jgi:hypothetical protein
MQTQKNEHDVSEEFDDNSKEGSDKGSISANNCSIIADEKSTSSPNSSQDEVRLADATSDSNSDAPSTPTNSIPEINENKPSKSTKVNICIITML